MSQPSIDKIARYLKVNSMLRDAGFSRVPFTNLWYHNDLKLLWLSRRKAIGVMMRIQKQVA